MSLFIPHVVPAGFSMWRAIVQDESGLIVWANPIESFSIRDAYDRACAEVDFRTLRALDAERLKQ